MMDQIWTRLQLLFASGVGKLVGHDRIQARVLRGEVLPNIDRIEPYGYSYRPKPGCQPYIVFPAGDRSYGVALVVGDKRYKMTLTEGEVALHDDGGNHVYLKRGGVIEAKASGRVIADTPLFEATGDAIIHGNLQVRGNTRSNAGYHGEGGGVAAMQSGLFVKGPLTVNGKDVSDAHTHTSNGPGVSTTGVD
uniref:Phage baseplate assembly protein V n=1 Tax=Candidatus Kentrum sp. LPFa TaxID=2126335 RepID=A0A450WM49_9GAMM|nr:MAG: phage baseplate assembly protein V [Candidatus Kentron sp. LPFa]